MLGLMKTLRERERRKASEEAMETVEKETHTHKVWYLNIGTKTGKGKRAGRHDGTKKC